MRRRPCGCRPRPRPGAGRRWPFRFRPRAPRAGWSRRDAPRMLCGGDQQYGDVFFVAWLSYVFTGWLARPHWILIDEAHHLLPTSWEPASLPQSLDQMIYVTVHPDQFSPAVLSATDTIIAVGETTRRRSKVPAPRSNSHGRQCLRPLWHRATSWFRKPTAPFRLRVVPGRSERRRHRRMPEGELPPDRSFYFQQDGRLKPPHQNLILFMQLADGVDDETWLYTSSPRRLLALVPRRDQGRRPRRRSRPRRRADQRIATRKFVNSSSPPSKKYYTVPVDAPKSL